ncbi:hypothetical protein ILUMI_13292 [Ignelater luminosus]|uniref:Cytochrome b5-related protein n=1 Tax=Ignelater luminosus TaxID=2038154 RepID=A0A8K0G5Y6_IGNLU|nr:hypothetical protein ILUMI_13292 [Ignelater luminosus]
MPPNTDSVKHRTSLNFKYPRNRDTSWKTGDNWLDDKRNDDGAEGLWRVHNKLYDLTDFINKHPGGPMWLELTKGTDITEAFESHHLTSGPEEMLKKHFIREAKTPRNSPFTFKEDGFYRTLKRNIRPILKEVPKGTSKASDRIIDSLLLGTFVFAILANIFRSYLFGMISGALLACNTVAAHNYFHRKDNFRMYYFNFSLMYFRDWRITHALSHHLFPNTIIDIEITFIEPFIEYLPKKKHFLVKYGSWVYVVFIWLTLFLVSFVTRVLQYIYLKDTRGLHWSEIIPFTLPLSMYLVSGQPLLLTIGMWLFIVTFGSLWFGVVGFNAAHHAPEIFHDGDAPRAKTDIDWGVHQLDAISERHDIKGSPFLVLTNFGDHALHHMFPTLDHGTLEHLYPIFNKTMKQFNLDLRMRSQLQMVKGQFMQLAKDKPNPIPPK